MENGQKKLRFMKIIRVLFYFFTVVLFINCSSVKLSDSWKSENYNIENNSKVLVAAKSLDLEIRKEYETAIVNDLKRKGISATELHKAFPNFNGVENPTGEKLREIIALFKTKNFSTLLVTSLKSTEIIKNDKRIEEKTYFSNDKMSKYLLSFNTDNIVQNVAVLPKNYENSSNDIFLELESTIYSLEANIFDLMIKPDGIEHVGVISVEVTNPKSGKNVKTKFSKIVAKIIKD